MSIESELLDAVVNGDHDRALKLLQAGHDPNQKRDGEGRTLLFETVEGDLEMTRLLVDHGADVNAATEHGVTVLMHAVRAIEREPAIVQLLIDAGADVNARTPNGYTPLLWAIDVNFEANAPDCVRGVLTALIEAGADLEAKQNWGWTPLMQAVMEGIAIEEVEVLLDHGADPFVAEFKCFNFCPEGSTLLHAAATDPDKLKLLLDAGLDPNAMTNEGQTALDIAEHFVQHWSKELQNKSAEELEEPHAGIDEADVLGLARCVYGNPTPEQIDAMREEWRLDLINEWGTERDNLEKLRDKAGECVELLKDAIECRMNRTNQL